MMVPDWLRGHEQMEVWFWRGTWGRWGNDQVSIPFRPLWVAYGLTRAAMVTNVRQFSLPVFVTSCSYASTSYEIEPATLNIARKHIFRSRTEAQIAMEECIHEIALAQLGA